MSRNGEGETHDEDWREEFPIIEECKDFSGRPRIFQIEMIETPGGLLARAIEVDKEYGYEFEALSEVTPGRALWNLREKMNRALSTRYMKEERGRRSFTHDKVEARLASDGVVIDGDFVPFTEFAEMLQVFEGFTLSMQIVDPTAEVRP